MKWTLLILSCLILFSCNKGNNVTPNKFYQKAKICRDANVSDSAFYYYNLAKNDYIKINDSLGVAKSLVNMAMIQTNSQDFYGGIESSLEANKFLKKEKDSTTRSTLATNYNNIALSFHFLKDFEKSIKFYFKALKYIDIENDKLLCYNNIGDDLITQGNFKLAQKYLEKAILTKNSINYSRSLNNLAKARYLDDKNYNPLPELYHSLKIREKNNDELGKNSSFETLSEYFLKRDKMLSLFYAKKMLETANNNKSHTDQVIALRKIIELDPKNYLENFQKYILISSNLQIARNKAKNQFAIVRYDVEKIQREKAEKEMEGLQKNFGIGILLMILIGGLFWYRKRKKRLEQEKELEVKNTQLRLSKKVHDVVANGIYQVMTKIENQEHFDKSEALDELEFVYEKSRDISYEKADTQTEEKDFSEKISETVSSFKNDQVNTYLAGNDKDIWKNLSSKNREEVYQIIRELLVNMKKHSKASIVSFRFERENDLIRIFYTDNGIGISGDVIYKNGLSSTVSRIETIKGEIIFDTQTEKGLKINISFPAS
ncbi:MAG: hypothetical protein P0Y62_12860 [Candidatus Chryseobacterium colombiense]|nr:tetratricopeptide repeat-containing sensor histidine kinase [Chryseobacterium sp.]WEK68737.1 MAG: hypothetical protein P0Y62_12860 [Chryseobacterium sp.]